MNSRRQIKTRVAGFNHRPGAAAILGEMKDGTVLKLVPEPTNQFDSKAIKVIGPKGQHLGYIPKDCNERVLAILLDRDAKVVCTKSAQWFNALNIDILIFTGDPLA